MGASHSVEPDVPVPEVEAPEPEPEPEPEEAYEEGDDIRWLWPFI
jgi:hypothetical protein